MVERVRAEGKIRDEGYRGRQLLNMEEASTNNPSEIKGSDAKVDAE
jgi:hypothetical protein